jgi:hypothetical protein
VLTYSYPVALVVLRTLSKVLVVEDLFKALTSVETAIFLRV